MAIYLDTNVICRWRTFGELDRLALSIASDQIGQQIVVPELVAVEATAHYRRELASALESFDKATNRLTRAFNLEHVHTEPQPDPDRQVRSWRQRLGEMCEVLPTHAPDAVTALEHEAHGHAPARERTEGKPGAGARDAAIWLAILRDHRERGEVGYFITKNTNDFLEGESFKPRLLEDLAGAAHPLHARVGVEGLLEGLGTSAEKAAVDEATVAEKGFSAVQNGLADSPIVPRAVFTPMDGHRFRTVVKEGQVVQVLKAERFARREDSVLVVDASWELLADCLFQDIQPDDPHGWGTLRDVTLTGRLQIYMPEETEAGAGAVSAQLIAAQLTADKTAHFMSDENLLIFG